MPLRDLESAVSVGWIITITVTCLCFVCLIKIGKRTALYARSILIQKMSLIMEMGEGTGFYTYLFIIFTQLYCNCFFYAQHILHCIAIIQCLFCIISNQAFSLELCLGQLLLGHLPTINIPSKLLTYPVKDMKDLENKRKR
jgi:hypothetical protein